MQLAPTASAGGAPESGSTSEEALNGRNAHDQATNTVGYALAYARHGWKVFPLDPESRKPLAACVPHGFLDASRDEGQIKAWWAVHPTAGIGVVPFSAGLVAIDIDTKPGQVGRESLEALEAVHSPLPPTLTARTPSGGEHRLFTCKRGFGNGRLGKNIDIRCASGYVAVEPTTIDGKTYSWLDWEPTTGEIPEIAELPEWVAGILGLVRDTDEGAHGGAPLPVIEVSAEVVEDLRSALAFMRSDDREPWVRMGMALKTLGDVGRELWTGWSQKSEKFHPVTASKTWNSFSPSKIGHKAVFAEAQREGWGNPRAGTRPGVREPSAEELASAKADIQHWLAELTAGRSMRRKSGSALEAERSTRGALLKSREASRGAEQGGGGQQAPEVAPGAAGGLLTQPPSGPHHVPGLWAYETLDLQNLREPEFVLDHIFQVGLVMIAGIEGAGKTVQMVSLLMKVAHLCLATDPLRPALRRKVIYITEDVPQVTRILSSLLRFGSCGFSEAEVVEWFKVVHAPRCDPMAFVEAREHYKDQITINYNADGSEHPTLPLVVLDTKSAVLEIEDENSNSEMSRAISILKHQFGYPTILIGHVSKAVDRSNPSGWLDLP